MTVYLEILVKVVELKHFAKLQYRLTILEKCLQNEKNYVFVIPPLCHSIDGWSR